MRPCDAECQWNGAAHIKLDSKEYNIDTGRVLRLPQHNTYSFDIQCPADVRVYLVMERKKVKSEGPPNPMFVRINETRGKWEKQKFTEHVVRVVLVFEERVAPPAMNAYWAGIEFEDWALKRLGRERASMNDLLMGLNDDDWRSYLFCDGGRNAHWMHQ